MAHFVSARRRWTIARILRRSSAVSDAHESKTRKSSPDCALTVPHFVPPWLSTHVFPDDFTTGSSPSSPTIGLYTHSVLFGKPVITPGDRSVSIPSCDSLRMLAAPDFALSLRPILRRIFGQHLRRPRSDDCGPASSGLLRSLESVPAMRRTRGQGASPPNPFHMKPVGSETV